MILQNLKSQWSENDGHAQRGWPTVPSKGRKTVIVRGRAVEEKSRNDIRRHIRPGKPRNTGCHLSAEAHVTLA